MQDIMGFRVSAAGAGAFTFTDQDEFAGGVAAQFPDCRTIDRRANPSQGYRAVHLVIELDGFPVEVQVRTYFQDGWANVTEALADQWGRGIRYGLLPDGDSAEVVAARVGVIDAHKVVADHMYALERAIDDFRTTIGDETVKSGLKDRSAIERFVEERLVAALDPKQRELAGAIAEFRRLFDLVG